MEPVQQYIVMMFGAAVTAGGLALMLLGHKEPGRNAVKIWGQEIELSTPALVVFLVGSAIFVIPFFLPQREPSGGTRTQVPAQKADRMPRNAVPQDDAPRPQVEDFYMTGDLAHLVVRLPPAEDRDQPCVVPRNATLIDEQTGEEWKPVSSSETDCGSSNTIWIRFPIGSGPETTFTLHVPGIEGAMKGLSLTED